MNIIFFKLFKPYLNAVLLLTEFLISLMLYGFAEISNYLFVSPNSYFYPTQMYILQ